MNLTLLRREAGEDGIFSDLIDESGKIIARTLDHAYLKTDGSYGPKLYDGVFTCQRGPHRLHNMTSDFETFEITEVRGHDNILFHAGNYNSESEGCLLLGQAEIVQASGNRMVTNSKATFAKFMELQDGIDQFTLTVITNQA